MANMIENCLNGQIDSTNLADYVAGTTTTVTTSKISDSAVTGAKVAPATLTPTNMADGVGQVASGIVTGDGTTNRVISVGFTPRWVLVVRGDATFVEYVSISSGGTAVFYYRDNTGAQGASTVNWQGIVAGGFKFGSGPGTSNVAAVAYTWVALK